MSSESTLLRPSLSAAVQAFEIILYHAVEPHLLCKGNGEVLYGNPAFGRWAGNSQYLLDLDGQIAKEDLEMLMLGLKQVAEGVCPTWDTELKIRLNELENKWHTVVIEQVPCSEMPLLKIRFGNIERYKVAQSKREKSAKRFRQLAQLSTDLLSIHTPDGRFKYASPSFEKALGRPAKSLLGRSPYEYFHPSDRERIQDTSHKKAVDEQANGDVTYRLQAADGHYHWLRTFTYPISDARGNVQELLCISRDITEEFLQRYFLEDTEKIARIAAWVYETSSQTFYFTKGLKSMFGLAEFSDRCQMDQFVQFFDRSSTEQLNRTLRLASKIDFKFELELHRTTAETAQTFRFFGKVVYGTEGDLLLSGTLQDVTNFKETERQLRKLAVVAENTQNSVITTDRFGRIEYVNAGFTQITGYELWEVVGKKPGSFLQGPATNPITIQKIREAIQEERVFTGDIFNYHKNGKGYWGHINIAPVHGWDGRLTGFVSVLTDISEKQGMLEKLAEKNLELAHTNQELDQFVYSASHDLRSPLASILGLIEVLRLEQSEEEKGEMIDYIERHVLRLGQFISDIESYSRTTRLQVSPEHLQLPRLIKQVTESLQYAPRFNELSIELEETGEEPFLTDTTRIKIILANLLSNSLKYAHPERPPRIKIRWQHSASQGTLYFEDNGIGIEPKYQSKIFDMFFQATKEAVGSGLGLYIVKQSIDRLKGHIQIESEPGKKTSFTLQVPNLIEQDMVQKTHQ